MPKDIPFYMLSNKAKRKRIEDEECNSTDSSNNNAIDRHIIELPNFSNSQHSEGFLCNKSKHSELSKHVELSEHSELSDQCNLSELSEQSELFEHSDLSHFEYRSNDEESDILHENINPDDPPQDSQSPHNSSSSSQSSEKSVSSKLMFPLNFLRGWALKHNITHAAISDLLAGLKENHECFADDESEPRFPTSARTLLQTEVKLIKKIVEPGYYIHIGLKKQLLKIAPKYFRNISTFKLLVNIDGLPLFKSSSAQVYPILCSVVSIPELRKKVFPIGIYYGEEKPDDLNKYLQDFIEEINNLIEHGLHFGNHTVLLEGTYFVCDAPAKSYIMGTVSYTGFSSCTRCTFAVSLLIIDESSLI